jgi:hypothetical protein
MTPEHALVLVAVMMLVLVTASALVCVAIVLPPRHWRELPWPERARLAHPARVAPTVTVFVLGWISVFTESFALGGFGLAPPMDLRFYVLIASLAGAIVVALVAAWLVAPRRVSIGYFLAGCGSRILFGFMNTAVFAVMAIALAIFPHDMATVILILIAGAVGIGFAAWGGGIWIANVLGLARAALPRATHAADWAGERVGVRAARVFELRWPRVTVDAFVFSRYLVVTDAAAELLNDDELFALSLRELTFFQQRWLAGFIRVADSVVIYFMLVCIAIGSTINQHAALIGALVGFVSAYTIRPFTHRAQLKADALAANVAIDPQASLRALEREYELNLRPVVAVSNRARDAHLYDRMVAAGLVPAYPRPLPPSRMRTIVGVLAAGVTYVVLSVAFFVAIVVLNRS